MLKIIANVSVFNRHYCHHFKSKLIMTSDISLVQSNFDYFKDDRLVTLSVGKENS